MYNSTPLNPRSEANKINFSLSATSNDVLRSFEDKKIDLKPYPKKENIVTTPTRASTGLLRRYSLSDVNLTPSSLYIKDDGRTKNSSIRSSPVIANGRYNINASTYLDSRSPGYASRMVRYNEEKERSLPTHHPKYNAPGVFPIVHLMKKDLPILKRKPSKVTVRMASPELSRYNSPEHNRMLLEKIMHSNITKKTSPQMSEVNTKSVLDALKEISRKRIHSNEDEYNVKDDGKRIRMDCFESPDPNKKRLRDSTSPKSESLTSPKLLTKKMCYMDEILASHSSMDTNPLEINKKLNFKSPTGEIESTPKKEVVKETKLVDVETQTLPEVAEAASKKSTESKESETEHTSAENTSTPKAKRPSPVKVFDEKPLEMMRKKRLSALMGSLKDTKNTELKDSDSTSTNNNHKDLVSILSSSHKSQKNEKHVTFNLSEASSDNSISLPAYTDVEKSSNNAHGVTQTSSALVTPIVSSVVTKSLSSPRFSGENLKPETSLPSVSTNITPQLTSPAIKIPESLNTSEGINNQTSTKPQFSFGVSNSTAVTSIAPEKSNAQAAVVTSPITFSFGNPVKPQSASTSGSTATTPSFSFGSKLPSSTVTTSSLVSTATASSSPNTPVGGFKFDLPKPVVTSTIATFTSLSAASNVAKSTALTFNFVGAKSITNTDTVASSTIASSFSVNSTTSPSTTNSTFSLPAATSSTTASPFKPFAILPSTTTASGGFSFVSVDTTMASGTIASSTSTNSLSNSNMPVFSFKSPNTAAVTTNTSTPISSFKFNSTPSLPQVSTSSLNFGVTSASTPTFSAPVATSSSTPSFGVNTTNVASFVNISTTSNSTTFASPLNKTPVMTFGSNNNTKTEIATTTNSLFNNPTKPTSTLSFFGASSSTSVPSFGVQTTQSFTSPIPSTFNTTKTGFTPTNNSFGNAYGTNPTPLNTSNVFNATKTTSATNIFGSTNPVTTSAINVFGSGNTLTSGSSSTFPTTTASNFTSGNAIFGGNTGLQTTGFVINSNENKTIFGASQPINFGATTTAPTPFGSNNNNNAFSTSTASNVFGSSTGFGVTTTATPSFGSNAPSTFGSSSFGNNQFGNGNVTSTTASSFSTTSFGNSAVNGFGATSSNNNSNTSVFGGSSQSPAAPAFGTANTSFNVPNNAFASSFTNSPSPFGSKPAENTIGFGATNAFGSKPTTNFGSANFGTNPTTTTQSGVFTFGSNTSNSKPAVFSFGASDPPKPFNFSGAAGNTPTPSFGVSNNNFGNAAPPAFGTAAAPQFNAPPGTPGMFSIGTGPVTPNRSRTQLKAKRRT